MTWKRLCRKLVTFFSRWTKPDKQELVTWFVAATANMELTKEQYVELAPLGKCHGPFRLAGNGTPTVRYICFERSIMEFIDVRVELSRPSRIEFICTISSTTAPEKHGQVVQTTPEYEAPFWRLAEKIFNYFPFYLRADRVSPLRKAI